MVQTIRKMSNSLSAGRWLKELQTAVNLLQTVGSGSPILAGSAINLTAALHNKRQVLLDQLAGSVCTLPPATGSGLVVQVLVWILPTSNSHKVKVANAQDFMIGAIDSTLVGTPTTNNGWVAANSGTVSTNSDTVNLNSTTTGAASKGEWLEFTDVAPNVWSVAGQITQSGAGATPFSAAV
jgi:hypothetical protein